MNLQDRLAGSTPPPPPDPPPPAEPCDGWSVQVLSGGQDREAFGVNAAGRICGGSSDGHAAVWDASAPATITELDFLGSDDSAIARSVNASGVVVGYGFETGDTSCDGGVAFHAYKWTGTTATELPPPGGDCSAFALGINASGQVAGYSTPGGAVFHAVIWNGTTPTVLDDLGTGTDSRATALNASAQVVGGATPAPATDTRAVVWDGGTTITDISGPGNLGFFVYGVNAGGVAVGALLDGFALGGAAWSDVTDGASITRLAPLGAIDLSDELTFAYGVSAAGVIVGTAGTGSDTQVPAVWDDLAATPEALPLLGLAPDPYAGDALGISPDGGYIVGWGYDADDLVQAVVWTRCETVATISSVGGGSSVHAGITKVHWTLDGAPIDLAGWNPNCNEGGYDQCRGQIPERQLMRLPWVGQGSTLTAQDSDGTIVWEGRMSSPPQIRNGIALLAAQGEKYAAVKKTDRLFIQSQDESLWSPTDSEPHLNSNGTAVYDHYRHIDVGGGKTRLMFKVDKDQALVSGFANGYVFYAEGVDLKRVAFWMNYDASDETSNLLIRLQRAAGPRGAETNVNTWATTNGNNGDEKDETMGAVDDLVILELKVDSNFTPSSAGRYILSHVRVNSDIELTDTFHAYEIAGYIGDTLGWDTGGVVASTFNSLPFDWDGDWASALDYLAENEDKMWRVTHDRNNLGPYLEYGDWGATNWQVYTHDGADPDLTPQELYDKVIVWFTAPNGIKRRAVSTTTANSSGNTFEYELADKQAEPTYAQLVADRLLRRYSVQRYQGVVPIVAAYDTRTGANAPYGILHGDTVTVADWRGGESQTLRVTDVEYGPAGVRVGVEQQINILSLLHKPRRKKKRHHGQHNG